MSGLLKQEVFDVAFVQSYLVLLIFFGGLEVEKLLAGLSQHRVELDDEAYFALD